MNVRGDQLVFHAVFMRGGTSKALIFKDADVPKDDEKRKRLFLAALGSPDPFGRQLDGLGGGLSSLSKICIVGPPSRTDADVDYTFAQVGIRDRTVDYGGNCGNMTSAIGPFAVDEGLVEAPSDGFASVRIHNTNTNKIILSTFPVRNCCAVVEGDVSIIGVAGRGAGIRLDFMAPGGTKGRGVLPTGEPLTLLELEAGASVAASLIDSANPCVFVRASDLGLTALEGPVSLDAAVSAVKFLEQIRRAASVAMGLSRDSEAASRLQSIPKVAIVAPAADYRDLAGNSIDGSSYDISIRMISMGQAHRAIPLTGALCAATAARIAGTAVAQCLATQGEGIRIGTPSGVLPVDAEVLSGEGSDATVTKATAWRTARRLMEGNILIPRTLLEGAP